MQRTSPNNAYIGFVPDQLRRQLEVGHFSGGWFDGRMMRGRDTAECSGGGSLMNDWTMMQLGQERERLAISPNKGNANDKKSESQEYGRGCIVKKSSKELEKRDKS
jgi:hypothetical protein